MRRLTKVSAAAAATVIVAIAAGLSIGGRDFARQHLGTLVVAVAFAVGLGTLAWHLVGGLMRGAILAVRRPRALGQSGAAAAEFVIVVIPFLLTLFGVMQMALASMARVLVSYSAFCAARAAIVFVPAEPKGGGASSGSPIPLPVATLSEDAGTIGKGGNTLTDFTTSGKAALIRNAASYALIPSSPAIDVVVKDTAMNWPSYWVNRVDHGLSPLDWIKSTVNDLKDYPSSVVDALNDKLKDAINEIGTKGADATKKDLDAWVKANVSDPTKQAQLQGALDKWVDDASKAGTGAAGGWVTSGINSTLDGPLSQYKDQISKWAAGAAQGAGGNIGGNFTGYAVDRALDVGFGSGTDGPQGALLRSLRKLIYARMATVVTLVDEKGGLKTKFEASDPITAKVTYLFYCQIPLANRFAGHAFYDLPDSTVMAMTTGPLGPAAMVGIPGYFMTLTAEHTLTNQGKP
ncbi:MAG TPA: TadE family protein [Polyangia bacterium]